MRAIIGFVSRRLQQMPYGLRVLTKVLLIFAFIFPIVTVISLLSHGSHFYFVISGKQVTYDEFLRRGGFLTFFLIGIYCAILVFGFLRASGWSRPLLLLPPVASPIFAVIYHHVVPFYNYLISLFGIALLVWYLFFRQTVRDYYARTHEPVA